MFNFQNSITHVKVTVDRLKLRQKRSFFLPVFLLQVVFITSVMPQFDSAFSTSLLINSFPEPPLFCDCQAHNVEHILRNGVNEFRRHLVLNLHRKTRFVFSSPGSANSILEKIHSLHIICVSGLASTSRDLQFKFCVTCCRNLLWIAVNT